MAIFKINKKLLKNDKLIKKKHWYLKIWIKPVDLNSPRRLSVLKTRSPSETCHLFVIKTKMLTSNLEKKKQTR